MELKELIQSVGLKKKYHLGRGLSVHLKKFTSDGFIRAKDMWDKYDHSTLQSYYTDFLKDYPLTFLEKNCDDCLKYITERGFIVQRDDLYKLLLYKLVIDSYVGFGAEEVIKKNLIKYNVVINDTTFLSSAMQDILDFKYGVDIITFSPNHQPNKFIQIKNVATMTSPTQVMNGVRRQFFWKEIEANKYIQNKGEFKAVHYYVYEIKENSNFDGLDFYFYVNPKNNKCHFLLNELINGDGSPKMNFDHLEKKIFTLE